MSDQEDLFEGVDSDENTTIEEFVQLSEKLEVAQETKGAVNVQTFDPFQSVKNSLFNFIHYSLERVTREQDFLSEVKMAISQKISQNELSPSQLVNLYRTVSEETNHSTQSILNIFMPTKDGMVSPLIDRNSSLNQTPMKEEGDVDMGNMSKEDRRAYQKLLDFLEGKAK